MWEINKKLKRYLCNKYINNSSAMDQINTCHHAHFSSEPPSDELAR